MRWKESALLTHADQMDDMTVEARIAKLESDMGHVKKDVAQISEFVSELQKGVAGLREDVSAVKATLPHFATRADIHRLETAMTRWFVGTLLGAGTLAFAVVRFAG